MSLINGMLSLKLRSRNFGGLKRSDLDNVDSFSNQGREPRSKIIRIVFFKITVNSYTLHCVNSSRKLSLLEEISSLINWNFLNFSRAGLFCYCSNVEFHIMLFKLDHLSVLSRKSERKNSAVNSNHFGYNKPLFTDRSF